MRKPTLISILVLAALLLTMLGCQPIGTPAASHTAAPSGAETEETALLTERQIRILEEQGLPTSYEALSLTQKAAIEAIEEMLCYLEQRYDDQFTYSGYVANSGVEQEHLYAVSEAYSNLGLVTVYRSYKDGSYTYSDNYSSLLAKPLYEEALNDWIAQSIPEEAFIVFSELSSADDDPQKERILSQASAASYILISEEACTKEALGALVDRFGPWIKEQARGAQPSVTLFYLTSPEMMSIATGDTYQDLLPKLRDGVYYRCSLSEDGNLQIHPGGG